MRSLFDFIVSPDGDRYKNSIKVGDKDTLELYCYDVSDAAGAHLQIEFDAGVITIDTVFTGDFFMNDNIRP